MSERVLEYAGLAYYDRTQGIEVALDSMQGAVVQHTVFTDPPDLFRRQAQSAEFACSEMSLSTYIAMLSRDDRRFVGLPVFPSRCFRHGQVYVAAQSGIEGAADLLGRRIGVPHYQMTAALWVRAFLEHDYDVAPSQVDWHVGGLRTPGYVERMGLGPPPGVSIRTIPETETLEGMLARGKLDGLVTVRTPAIEPESYRRLFADYGAVERDYFARTGFYPIMHLVVLRRDLYEATPGLAAELVQVFESARRAGRERLRREDHFDVALPWLPESLAELDKIFDGDPYAYGVESNRAILDAALDYSFEQGLSARRVEVEELFAPELLPDQPIKNTETVMEGPQE
jgi:4,5-dihydroxyphthalate decarboxylase